MSDEVTTTETVSELPPARSYALQILDSGHVRWRWGTSTYTSTEPVDTDTPGLRVTVSLDDSSGFRVVTFKTGTDDSTMTQLGAAIVTPLEDR